MAFETAAIAAKQRRTERAASVSPRKGSVEPEGSGGRPRTPGGKRRPVERRALLEAAGRAVEPKLGAMDGAPPVSPRKDSLEPGGSGERPETFG
jgi:hypothetical protein